MAQTSSAATRICSPERKPYSRRACRARLPHAISLDVIAAEQEHGAGGRLERHGSSTEDSAPGATPGRAQHATRAQFDLMASKLRRPVVRPGTVPRRSLIDRLAKDDVRPVVSVVAPSGYGKTTLLSQWAGLDRQSFAWVSLDDRDNDPKVLLSYVA